MTLNSPALEGLEDTVFTRGQIEAGAIQIMETAGVGNESVQLNAHELMASLGWEIPRTARNAPKATFAW